MHDKRSSAFRLGDHADRYELVGTNKDSLASDDELDADQLAAMDELMRVNRADKLPSDEVQHIAAMIRLGHVAAARRHLTRARDSE